MKTLKSWKIAGLIAALLALLAVNALAEEPGWNEGGGEEEAALKLTPNLEHAKEVYQVCAACHLLEGWGTKEGTFPQLAGQHKNVIIKQLADIRDMNRDNPTMYPFALAETIGGPQSIADVAAYITTLPMSPDNGKGEWAEGTPQFAKGKELFETNCVQCHGANGEGNNEKFYPRIQGQHYAYMLRQFEWIRDGKRRNANPDMAKQIANFSDEDEQMVVNYVSRIPVPKADLAPSVDYHNPDFK